MANTCKPTSIQLGIEIFCGVLPVSPFSSGWMLRFRTPVLHDVFPVLARCVAQLVTDAFRRLIRNGSPPAASPSNALVVVAFTRGPGVPSASMP